MTFRLLSGVFQALEIFGRSPRSVNDRYEVQNHPSLGKDSAWSIVPQLLTIHHHSCGLKVRDL